MKSFEDRFWEKVNRNGPIPEHMPHLGPCWVWTAAIRTDGYGLIRHGQGSMKATHRVAWALQTGAKPTAHVLHHCDNRRCVRLTHLFLGTYTDNMRDCVAKGRLDRKGAKNSRARLTEDDVIDIRTVRALGADPKDLAEVYGITQDHIVDICSGRAWSHVQGGLRQ